MEPRIGETTGRVTPKATVATGQTFDIPALTERLRSLRV
jgi:hypothetical protein